MAACAALDLAGARLSGGSRSSTTRTQTRLPQQAVAGFDVHNKETVKIGPTDTLFATGHPYTPGGWECQWRMTGRPSRCTA